MFILNLTHSIIEACVLQCCNSVLIAFFQQLRKCFETATISCDALAFFPHLLCVGYVRHVIYYTEFYVKLCDFLCCNNSYNFQDCYAFLFAQLRTAESPHFRFAL